MAKPTIIFVNNYIWSIDSNDVKMKYEMLSRTYRGVMFYLCLGEHENIYGDFRCLSSHYHKNAIKRWLVYTLFCLKSAKTLGKVDVIIVYDPLIPGIIGFLLKLFTGASLIVEVNTNNVVAMNIKNASWLARFKNNFVPIITRFILRRADGIKFVSAALRNETANRIDLASKKISNFIDFVPASDFRPSAPQKPLYILTVGFPYQIKGIDVLIRAFNLITDEFPDIRLKIIGHCDDRTPYIELAAGNPAIEFHKGMPYEQVVTQFEQCLLFVLASRTEGTPRVLVEAMAAGKPVIGSRVGGIPELIEDGVNGYLFDSENHTMLAEKMRLLLGNPGLIEQMGEASYRIAQERYMPDRYIELYQNLISEVMGTAVNPTLDPVQDV